MTKNRLRDLRDTAIEEFWDIWRKAAAEEVWSCARAKEEPYEKGQREAGATQRTSASRRTAREVALLKRAKEISRRSCKHARF